MVRLSSLAAAAGFFSSSFALSASEIPSDLPVSSLLESAQSHLSRGQTSDALLYYDAAVARDPSNYLTFFKRATTYLSLGRTNQATEDFNKVLSLKPGFEGAHTQLGRLKARSGEWDAAREQYLLAHKKADSKDLEELTEAEGGARLAESAAKSGNWEDCVNHADVAIQLASRSLSLRELRCKCRFEAGQIAGGLADLMHVLQLKPGDITPYVRISATQFYALDERDDGMAQSRKCLMSDPDSKMCRKLLKEEKAVDKGVKRVEEALERKQPITAAKQLAGSKTEQGLIQQVKDQVEKLRADGTIPATAGNALVSRLVGMACQAYYTIKKPAQEKTYCAEALSLNENSFYGLLHTARLQTESESYDAAIATLTKAKDSSIPTLPDSQQQDAIKLVQNLLHEAQAALKRSKQKDYYKVLGLDRAHDPDERQIKAAYRKLTKLHHPDKAAKQGITKEDAEKKMAAINEAYEVLSNPELKARFDRGDDPNSHEQQNPFQQGGRPFGGGFGGGFPGGGFPGGGRSGGQQHFQFQWGGGGFPFGG
jgi:DnaJ family protein C protein 3